MNTDVHRPHDAQRTHRIVVGVGVALIATAGISTVAVNVHHAVIERAVPDVAFAGHSMADSAPLAAAPPPQAAAPIPHAAVAGAAEAAASQAPVPSATVPEVTSQGSSATAVRQYRNAANAPADSSMSISEPRSRPTDTAAIPVNQYGTVVSATPGASASIGDERQFARNVVGKVDIAAGDSGARGAVAAGNSLRSGAGANVGEGEVGSVAQARAAGGDAANPDRMITEAVQTQIAAATADAGARIAVNTINGLVILTGTAPSADVVEHVKQVVQQVRNVQGVDATAVHVSSF